MPMRVVIVGGGMMGAATACFLARDHGADVTVLERDPTCARASSALSAGSIRVQFSQPVNIALSRWSLAFLRRVGDELAVDGGRPAIGLVEPGHLHLATAAGADALRANHEVQRAAAAEVALLDPAALHARYPWLHVDDLALGALGLSTAGSGEGWFDGPALMQAFRRKAIACSARFVVAEAVAFDTAGERVTAVRIAGGTRHAADAVMIAAGAWPARCPAGPTRSAPAASRVTACSRPRPSVARWRLRSRASTAMRPTSRHCRPRASSAARRCASAT